MKVSYTVNQTTIQANSALFISKNNTVNVYNQEENVIDNLDKLLIQEIHNVDNAYYGNTLYLFVPNAKIAKPMLRFTKINYNLINCPIKNVKVLINNKMTNPVIIGDKDAINAIDRVNNVLNG